MKIRKQDLQSARTILKEFGATEIYLFGSFAQGKARKDSDLDLAVKGLPPQHFFRALGQLMFNLHRPVHLVDLDERNEFTAYLEKKGELVSLG